MILGEKIAVLRKQNGWSQEDLAEQLQISRQSVSKWERGICLPDVSVYLELCEILDMSINEFLAGEEIPAEKLAEKSADNLLQVTKDSKNRQKFLKRIIAALIIVTCIVLAAVSGYFIREYINESKSYIVALDPESPEMKTAKLISGFEEAHLFRYSLHDRYEKLLVYMSEYHSGELIEKSEIACLIYDNSASPTAGMLAVVPDFEDFTVRLVISDDTANMYTDFSILEEVEGREYYGRSATRIEDRKMIKADKEQGLCTLIYGKDGIRMTPVDTIESGDIPDDNDYIYYFSYCFFK